MRWLLLLVGACTSEPPAAPRPPPPAIVLARIELADSSWIDVTTEGRLAMERCAALVGQQLMQHDSSRLTRACDSAALPVKSSKHQLAMPIQSRFGSPPNDRYRIETFVPFDSADQCEARKAALEAEEVAAYERTIAERQRAREQFKRICEESYGPGAAGCERFFAPPTFRPASRTCRARH